MPPIQCALGAFSNIAQWPELEGHVHLVLDLEYVFSSLHIYYILHSVRLYISFEGNILSHVEVTYKTVSGLDDWIY
jgi:hypothetical protein